MYFTRSQKQGKDIDYPQHCMIFIHERLFYHLSKILITFVTKVKMLKITLI